MNMGMGNLRCAARKLDVRKKKGLSGFPCRGDEGTPIQDGRFGNDSATRSQKKQKCCYNEVTREGDFEVGDTVLGLLPSEVNNLKPEWVGP